MGGSQDKAIIVAEDTLELTKKYRELVRQREWSHGHNGYSGTFAEKPVLKIIDGLWDEGEAYLDCSINNDKWGPAFAYQLKNGTWYIGGVCSS